MAQRQAAATASQDSVVDQVAAKAGGAPKDVVHYAAANAFSATVTQAQADALASDPSVAMVVPNRRISVPVAPGGHGGRHGQRRDRPGRHLRRSARADPSKPLLEPEALDRHAHRLRRPDGQDRPAARHRPGVKVAYIADGIDPANPDLIRADGSRVITDYKAFSADGPDPEDGGAEAYGDASAIAAQGRVAHDLSTTSTRRTRCPRAATSASSAWRPGASIVALKIDFYTTSIIQAIDYATSTAKVDVINESFGGNAVPDAATRSAISLFNDAAVKAGITVTVSSGDAGTTSTIGNPATDPQVISVAANTNNRGVRPDRLRRRAVLRQRQVGQRPDLLALLGRLHPERRDGRPHGARVSPAGRSAAARSARTTAAARSDIQLFGGTSQSAPLTAGAAALVIEAYRSTHGGASPSPARVKQLLTSTAPTSACPPSSRARGCSTRAPPSRPR